MDSQLHKTVLACLHALGVCILVKIDDREVVILSPMILASVPISEIASILLPSVPEDKLEEILERIDNARHNSD